MKTFMTSSTLTILAVSGVSQFVTGSKTPTKEALKLKKAQREQQRKIQKLQRDLRSLNVEEAAFAGMSIQQLKDMLKCQKFIKKGLEEERFKKLTKFKRTCEKQFQDETWKRQPNFESLAAKWKNFIKLESIQHDPTARVAEEECDEFIRGLGEGKFKKDCAKKLKKEKEQIAPNFKKLLNSCIQIARLENIHANGKNDPATRTAKELEVKKQEVKKEKENVQHDIGKNPAEAAVLPQRKKQKKKIMDFSDSSDSEDAPAPQKTTSQKENVQHDIGKNPAEAAVLPQRKKQKKKIMDFSDSSDSEDAPALQKTKSQAQQEEQEKIQKEEELEEESEEPMIPEEEVKQQMTKQKRQKNSRRKMSKVAQAVKAQGPAALDKPLLSEVEQKKVENKDEKTRGEGKCCWCCAKCSDSCSTFSLVIGAIFAVVAIYYLWKVGSIVISWGQAAGLDSGDFGL